MMAQKNTVSPPDSSKTFLVAGNWKMNPETVQEAKALFSAIKDSVRTLRVTHIVVAPPFLYLDTLRGLYSGKKISLSAQTHHVESSGSYTGEVSAPMIKSLGVEYVIIGHSERRAMGETDEDVRARVEAALKEGLTPIVCIGENKRDNNGEYLSFIRNQLKELFYGFSKDWLRRIVIAYEPIWAIGSKSKGAMSAHELHETAIYIRKVLSELFDTKRAKEQVILYGGSVDASNAPLLIDGTQVNGFLVGRASLESETFLEIAKAVEAYAKKI